MCSASAGFGEDKSVEAEATRTRDELATDRATAERREYLANADAVRALSDRGHHSAPSEKWEFNESVASVFDDMLARSIPQYPVMREAVTEIASLYLKHGTTMLDLGCSRGETLAPMVDRFGAYNHFVGLEISQPMLETARKRFSGWIGTRIIDIREHDLRNGVGKHYPAPVSVCTAVLTLQFVPVEHRQKLIKDVFNLLQDDGCFIVVEKLLAPDDLTNLYYKLKLKNGYSQEEIDRKKLALEGVLVPWSFATNQTELEYAGFHGVTCFWKWMNFAAWRAIK